MAPKPNALTAFLQATAPLTSLPALTVVSGANPFLGERAIAICKKQAQLSDICTTSVEAPLLDGDAFADLWRQSSIFENATLFVLRRSEQAKALAKHLKTIPDARSIQNRLLIHFGVAKMNTALKKELQRLKAFIIPCSMPHDYELPRLFPEFAKMMQQDFGVYLGRDALALLTDAVGFDLGLVANELKTLALIHPESEPDKPLSVEQISEHLGLLREDHAFELDKLLLNRNYAKASILVRSLLQRGHHGPAILGLLARHCRQALNIKGLGSNVTLRLPPKVLRSYTQYVAQQKTKNLSHALAECAKVDVLLKTSKIDDELLLTRVIDVLAT